MAVEEVQLGFCRYEAVLSPTMKRGEDHVSQSRSQSLSLFSFMIGSDALCDLIA